MSGFRFLARRRSMVLAPGGMIWSCWTRYPWLQPRPGCWQRIVTVGPGRSTVTVTVGPGLATVTVRTGCGTLTVTVGVGLRPCRGLVVPRTTGTVIATISARPSAATIVSKPFDSGRLRALLRWLLPGRSACGVITRLMVDRGVARRSDIASGQPPLCRRRDPVTADDLAGVGFVAWPRAEHRRGEALVVGGRDRPGVGGPWSAPVIRSANRC